MQAPEGRIVRVQIAGKERPAIVLEVRPTFTRVIYGTTEVHDWPREVVNVGGRSGRLLDLRETTYFYGANTSCHSPSELRPLKTQCSLELFYALWALVDEFHARIGGLPPRTQ